MANLDHIVKDLLNHEVRVQVIGKVDIHIYSPAYKMLDKSLVKIILQNNKLEGMEADSFIFDRKQYYSTSNTLTVRSVSPILHGSLRGEFRYYKAQHDEVMNESKLIRAYLNKMTKAVKSREELLAHLPESIHSKLGFVRENNFQTVMSDHEWVLGKDCCEKHLDIMKTRLTYNLLEVAA